MEFVSSLAKSVFEKVNGELVEVSEIPGLKLYSCQQEIDLMPIVIQPSICFVLHCFVLQAKKRVSTGQQSFVYSEDSYLINSVTRPVEASLLDVSQERPYVGFSLAIDQQMVGQLMMEMSPWQKETSSQPQRDFTQATKMTKEIENVVTRLLGLLNNPMDREILAPSIFRELYYQVLKGPGGGLLRNCVSNHAGANRVAPVIHYIEQNFERNLAIEEIASVAGMSASTLHEHFKQVTTVSPMQYVKSLRLHKARSMLSSGYQVAEVCYEVGYSSPSQFSREFKRYFGFTPSEARSLATTIE
ncbi:AraC family transcriptional regulator [Grimontia marina]|uniref:HTH-type transcriptional activator RhaS n=1 Tax=Grimontia marina TaxID=646534 RepID=A0A128FCR2_9GAMM|nr:AraC family transcriptional regulator [Grimontia marina]CZF84300.1 HTH-type transcriptional activator RhaS [Grimontia marina]